MATQKFIFLGGRVKVSSDTSDINVFRENVENLSPDVQRLGPFLKTICIHRAKMQSIPKEIGNIAKFDLIREIAVDDNKLHVIPPEIVRLKTLTRLSLSNNLLEVLPPGIGRLHNLSYRKFVCLFVCFPFLAFYF